VSKDQIKILQSELKEMRRYGCFKKIGDAEYLCELMGCPDDVSTDEKISRFIQLISHFIKNKDEIELLFLAFGIHGDYQYVKGLDARRVKHYEDRLAAERELNDPKRSLRNLENQLTKELIPRVIEHGNIPEVVAGAPKTLELPTSKSVRNGASDVIQNLPYSRNPYFTGRDDKLLELRKHFTAGKSGIVRQMIHGLGGMGKSQLSLEYAYTFAKDYDVIWWLDAETKETMEAAIYSFVQREHLNDKDDPAVTLGTFQRWFETHTKWLLICDNVEDFKIVEKYLPKLADGHIIYTTRHGHGLNANNSIRLDALPAADSATFLQDRAGLEDNENAARLAKRLGYLPLAMDHAAAYIFERSGTDFTEYLKLLDECGLRLLEEEVSSVDYELTVSATWKISMDKIQSEAARQLMYLCAYLSPDYIDLMLFYARPALLPTPLGAELADQLKRKNIIRELEKYSLIRCSIKKVRRDDTICLEQQLHIHPLLQEVIRAETGSDTTYVRCCLALMQGAHHFIICGIGSEGEDLRKGIANAVSIATYAEKLLSDDASLLAIANLSDDIGLHIELIKQQGHMEWRNKALDIRKRVLGEQEAKKYRHTWWRW